jgi:AraC-like DNA-binding protein
MDPLSEVLRAVRLTGGVFIDAQLTAPWCMTTNMDANDCRPFLETPTQLIAYHFIIAGRLLLFVDGEPPIEIGAGEIVLFPRNDRHTMGSADGITPVRAGTLIAPPTEGNVSRIRHGGGGEMTHLVCGFLATEDDYNPLIAALPRVLTLDVREATSRDWIEASVRFAAAELAQGRLASSQVMSRLSETLFVEAVRHYASTRPEETSGWLKGLRDPQIGRALALIHQDIAADLSVEALASDVAMSRSAFVNRFTTLVGVPPIRYLTLCRLQAAKLHLRESRRSIAQLANLVGYESEEAFSRAFKREFGMPPARWRDQPSAEQPVIPPQVPFARNAEV